MQLTKDQQLVVTTRNKDILVSAAAGSGKTAVLVERILDKITDKQHPVDIDRMLIVTFTNAAAAEMRERIHREICNRLDQHQEDENLQRQASLIHNAQITTIDSFCLFLLRNHFYEIGLDPGFRIADPGEMKLLETKVLTEVLEEFYETGDEEFLQFCDAYSPDGKDGRMEELIMQLYHLSMSHPWPLEWLSLCGRECKLSLKEALWDMQWMKFWWQLLETALEGAMQKAGAALCLCEKPGGPYMYEDLIRAEKEAIHQGMTIVSNNLSEGNYLAFQEYIRDFSFGRLSSKKDESVSVELREQVKQLRQDYKDILGQLKTDYFTDSMETVLQKERLANEQNHMLILLTKRYLEVLAEKKREMNIVDFSDAEHMALQVLYENGKPTQTALSYRDYFDEVMIDEYQDSNLVQELLLSSIAKTRDGFHNRFMVGDMKQSIYKFRLARPEIFMEKYNHYKEEDDNTILISLKQNFRSRFEVLESINDVFRYVMKPGVGGIAYDADAALYLGAAYPSAGRYMEEDLEDAPEGSVYQTEILLLEKEKLKQIGYRKKEAQMIAQRIKKMVGRFPVSDGKGGVRPAAYKDMVILIRSEKGVAGIIRSKLLEEGIPVHVTSKEGYFSASEISVLMDFLRILDNPYDEIALCSCLKSVFFSFTDEMLSLVRIGSKAQHYFDCLKECAKQENEFGEITSKVLQTIADYRRLAVYLNVTELVNHILKEFHYVEYVSAMPAGQQRKANVEMFVEKTVDFEKTGMHGLFAFIQYMEQLKRYQVDFGEASTMSETADAVRIMTIHKSKGLEFPICFVACCDKGFHMGDMKQPVLMDADWGIASDYIDLSRRVKGKTFKKKVLAEKMKRDAIGEELRVLYVAMTRAKEKLILTGCDEQVQERLNQYRQMSDTKKDIPVYDLADCSSMLEFLYYAYVMDDKNIRLSVLSLQDLENDTALERGEQIDKRIRLSQLFHGEAELTARQKSEVEYLKEKFDFQYPHQDLKGLYAKTSVSELKKAAMEEAQLHPAFETDNKTEPILPGFMKGEEKPGGTARGSAVHRMLELLDFVKYASIETKQWDVQLKKDLDSFVRQGRMMPEYAPLVPIEKIACFLRSSVAGRMMQAAGRGRLFKEQPFVLSLSANRVNPQFPEEETVLIQGIIDVYFEEEGQFVILDYKTDRVSSCVELKSRYETQLNFYEEAVRRITRQPVKEKILYSFALSEELKWK